MFMRHVSTQHSDADAAQSLVSLNEPLASIFQPRRHLPRPTTRKIEKSGAGPRLSDSRPAPSMPSWRTVRTALSAESGSTKRADFGNGNPVYVGSIRLKQADPTGRCLLRDRFQIVKSSGLARSPTGQPAVTAAVSEREDAQPAAALVPAASTGMLTSSDAVRGQVGKKVSRCRAGRSPARSGIYDRDRPD